MQSLALRPSLYFPLWPRGVLANVRGLLAIEWYLLHHVDDAATKLREYNVQQCYMHQEVARPAALTTPVDSPLNIFNVTT